MSLEAILRVGDRLDVTVLAEPGDIVAVIGPNGAGKSTLVRALAGLVEAEGQALLDGRDLLRLPARERSVGMVFQERLLFPHLSARANVAFGPRSRGTSRREAEQIAANWLARLGISELARRKPRELSGGQAQRVSIARALATDPRLLLLDEPMTGLDVGVATALRIELAQHLAAYDGITLLVTHDPIDALTIANQVLVIDDGRVAQVGSPAEVAQRPATEHVARLVGLNVLRDGEQLRVFSPTSVTVTLEEPRGSARNRWRGDIVSATPHGAALRLVVRAEADLIADVTPQAATELGLVPGRAVWLSVKETSVSAYAAART